MKRFRFSLFLLSLLLLLTFTGCDKENSTEESTTTVTPTPTVVPEEPTLNLYISEVMADNSSLILDTDFDWIEIGSLETKDASLNGYYLTDNLEKADALSLTGKTIDAGGFLVVVLDDDAPFHLNDKGETIYLTHNGEVVSELSYTEEIGKASASKDGVLPFVSPGFPNTTEGYIAYSKSIKLPEIMISEVLASNSKYADASGNFYDAIELHNSTTADIDIKGLYLSDKEEELTKYEIPEQTLASDGYLLVYCSGLDAEGHASFKLSEGETVYLSDGEKILDKLPIPKDLSKNISYGRYKKDYVYMYVPTLGEANKPGRATRLKTPEPSVEPGLYEASVTVELTGEGTIYYTLDGSRPTERSMVYEEPITLEGVTTIRTFSVEEDSTSDLGSYTYLVGIEHTLPVVYVSLPNSDVSSITSNPYPTIERECVASLYEDGEMKFSVPCGFRLNGVGSRVLPKQSFQLRFRSKYGLSKLKYKVFDDLDIDTFDSLLLKSGSEDYAAAVLRDEFCTGLCDGTTNLEILNCKPCVLYVGDRFWGIYYLRERFSSDYVAEHYDVSKESVDLIYGGSSAQDGSITEYHALLEYVRSHDMTNEEYYQYVMDRIDPVSLMDWYICRTYMGDKDVGNIRCFRSTDYDSKWRWMYFDLDWAFYHTTDRPITDLFMNSYQHAFIACLLKNPEFKDMFLKRYNELMDTILNEEYISKSLDEFAAIIEPEIEKDHARWGLPVNSWYSSITRMHNYVKDGARTKNVLYDIKSFFHLSDEEMKAYFGDKWIY